MTPAALLKKYEQYQRMLNNGVEAITRQIVTLSERLDAVSAEISEGFDSMKEELYDEARGDYGNYDGVVTAFDSAGVPDSTELLGVVELLKTEVASPEFDNAIANIKEEIAYAKSAPAVDHEEEEDGEAAIAEYERDRIARTR